MKKSLLSLRKYEFLGVALGLITINLVIYSPVRNFSFINWDDGIYVKNNPYVLRGLTWQGVSWALTTGYAANWHPVTWLSHMLDVQMFGVAAGPQHITNVVLHILSSILLFAALYKLTSAPVKSAFVAAIFAAHPLHVESVTWVAERKDVLSTMFAMCVLLAYALYFEQPSAVRWIAVIVLFALGLMAKPMLVSLPLVLLLVDCWPLRRVRDPFEWGAWRPCILEKIPLFVLAFASSVITFVAQQQGGTVRSLRAVPAMLRLANAVTSCCFYLVKSVWPADLAVFYPYVVSPWPWVAASIALLAAISFVAVRVRLSRPYLFTGWLWYLLTLVPVIGIVQVGQQARADRYTYFPVIGLVIIAAWGMPELLQRWKHGNIVAALAASVAIMLCIGVSRVQAEYWQSDETLWTHAIGATEDNYLAYGNLARDLVANGRSQEAIERFNQALRIGEHLEVIPDLSEIRSGLGFALADIGRSDEAIESFQGAIRDNPDLAEAHNGLGTALAQQGKAAMAIVEFQRALEIRPDDARIHTNLGYLLAQSGRTSEAMQQYDEAVEIQPDNSDAYNLLGRIQASGGNYKEAIESYKKALRTNPEASGTLKNLGIALAEMGKSQDALSAFSRSLQLDPHDGEVYYDVGVLYAKGGNDLKAVEYFATAVRITPKHIDAHYNLGASLENLGRREEALKEYGEVLRLDPSHIDARRAIDDLEHAGPKNRQ
jgi:tetratricopeptide (TPR) repeat protein